MTSPMLPPPPDRWEPYTLRLRPHDGGYEGELLRADGTVYMWFRHGVKSGAEMRLQGQHAGDAWYEQAEQALADSIRG